MDLSKEYIGKVIYIDDVTHTGRCKIRVFGLFDTLDDENIPWFTPGNTTKFSSYGGGSIDIPKIGSIVKVKFTNNDLYSGEYYSLPMLDPKLVNEIKDDYEDTHVLLFDSDEELAIIYQKMTGIKIFHKNSSIIIDPTGIIQLKHQNNQNVIEINQDNITIAAAGTKTINISSGNTVEIKADNIHLNSNNVTIGPNGSKRRLVCYEELDSVLTQFAAAIAIKFPLGPPITSESWSNIQAPGINCQ